MILYSSSTDALSHCARLVAAEKNIACDIIDVNNEDRMDELAAVSPYSSIPTLLDRELVVYNVRIISEYIDERFPHPPLMPVDPVSRAHTRLALYRVFTDWYSLLPDIEGNDREAAAAAKRRLRESIAATADTFAAKPFFLSDSMGLADCAVTPVLWRLPYYRIELPPQAAAIERYSKRLFARRSFQRSLTEFERDMNL